MSDRELILRQALVCASGVFYWAAVSVQVARVRRRIGRHPNLKPRGTLERLLWLAWFTVILVWVGQPVAMGRLFDGPVATFFRPLVGAAGLILGLLLIVGGQAGTFWCYRVMGEAWRMGIRRRERTALVTAGPYAAIRHPIYSLQMLTLLGVVLLLPTPLSIAVFALHTVCCVIKARHEEQHLVSVHGQRYRDYIAATGRFLPKLARSHRS